MSTPEQWMELDELLLGPELGKGGEATIFAIGKREALKLYHPGTVADGKALTRLIIWREGLAESDRRLIDASCSWPTARVDRGGTTVGCLMPRIPPRFMQALNTGLTRPREIQYLCQPEHSEALGIAMPSQEDRLALCLRYARVLTVLERNGIVFGDVSLRNLLWAAGKRLSVYWIDCDSARRAGTTGVRPPVATIHWNDPALGDGDDPDLLSDRYLLALAIFRVLFQDPYARPGKDDPRLNGQGRLPEELAEQLTEGLTGPREDRPPAEQLAATLETARPRIEAEASAAPGAWRAKRPPQRGKRRGRVAVEASRPAPAADATKRLRGTIPVSGETSESSSAAGEAGVGEEVRRWATQHQDALVASGLFILALLVLALAVFG